MMIQALKSFGFLTLYLICLSLAYHPIWAYTLLDEKIKIRAIEKNSKYITPEKLPIGFLGKKYEVLLGFKLKIHVDRFILEGDLPPGLKFLWEKGASEAYISGIPEQKGDYPLVVMVVAGGETYQREYKIIIEPEEARMVSIINKFSLGKKARIVYRVNVSLPVTLKIYNLLGDVIKTFEDGQIKEPKTYTVFWDGRNDSGEYVSAGLYILRLEAGNLKKLEKIVFIK